MPKFTIISASSLAYFSKCPRMFYYSNIGAKPTDKIRTAELFIVQPHDIHSLIAKNMSTISLDDTLTKEISVSASSLGQFKKCRKAFNYRITKTPPSDRVPLTNFQFGSLVHNTMDNFIAGLKEKYGALTSERCDFKKEFLEYYYSEALKEIITTALSKSDEWMESKTKVFKNFYISLANHFKFLYSITSQGLEPQLNFWFGTPKNPLAVPDLNIPNIRLIGEIDHFYENCRGNLTIEDTKTSGTDYYLDRNQLYLYAIALEQYYLNKGVKKRVDELNYNLVKVGKKVPVPFGSMQREALIADLSALNTCLQLNQFRPTEGKHCEQCAWRTRCKKERSFSDTQNSTFVNLIKQNKEKK